MRAQWAQWRFVQKIYCQGRGSGHPMSPSGPAPVPRPPQPHLQVLLTTLTSANYTWLTSPSAWAAAAGSAGSRSSWPSSSRTCPTATSTPWCSTSTPACWASRFVLVIDQETTGCPVKLFPLGYLLFCRLLLMQIAKVEPFLKNSGNLLHDRHKNFENRFRNSWDNWGQSCHL